MHVNINYMDVDVCLLDTGYGKSGGNVMWMIDDHV